MAAPVVGPPSPRDFFGFLPGKGRLAGWDGLCAYYEALAASSPWVRLFPVGSSVEGRSLQALAFGAERDLQDVERAFAEADGRLEPVAGRAVLVQTCGVHAAEAAAPQLSARLAHALAKPGGPAAPFRGRLLFVLVPAVDPDGLERVRAWHEQAPAGAASQEPPGLVRRYAGHDINRDWIMQTQPEVAAVAALHRRLRTHVVLDMHEMWSDGPRMFLPPYAPPADAAADPATSRRAASLGRAMAARLDAAGLSGIATGVVFDGHSPARVYPHHHAAVRLLCEVAGAGLAGSVHIPPTRLRTVAGFDPRSASPAQPRPWPGGTWSSADVARYQWAATWACLTLVAQTAPLWVRWQRRLQRRATDPARRPGCYVLPRAQRDPEAARELERVLRAGDLQSRELPSGDLVIPRAQPCGTWADALLTPQPYPEGGPAPYDVTAHLLPPLMGVDCRRMEVLPARMGARPAASTRPCAAAAWPAADSATYRKVFTALAAGTAICFIAEGDGVPAGGAFLRTKDLPAAWRGGAVGVAPPRVGVYGSWRPTSDEGWLRYVLDRFGQGHTLLRDADMLNGELHRFTHLVLPALRGRDLVHGLGSDRYPAAWAGGLGDRGRRRLAAYVQGGGQLLAVEGAAAWAQAALDLPLRDRTASGEPPPSAGAVVELDVAPGPLGSGLPARTAVLYRGGPAFEAAPQAAARFAPTAPLCGLSPPVALAGAAAVLRWPRGRGACVLYGFSPYFRAQTWAGFRWLFNALLL